MYSHNFSTLIEDIVHPWNPERFLLPRLPIYVGKVRDRCAFLSEKVSCLDMLIKIPFGEVKIPYSDRSIIEIVNQCVAFEKTINPNWNNYYAYLTIDQRFVRQGLTHRREGIHFDGMQGAAYSHKLFACHSYLVCDTLPTRFYVQEFGAKYLNEIYDNWFVELGKQATIQKVFYPQPFDIFLMTAYQIHEAVPASKSTERTFMRVEFTLKQYNRVGNTLNPLIQVGWKFVDREIPKPLRTGRLRDTGWKQLNRSLFYSS